MPLGLMNGGMHLMLCPLESLAAPLPPRCFPPSSLAWIYRLIMWNRALLSLLCLATIVEA